MQAAIDQFDNPDAAAAHHAPAAVPALGQMLAPVVPCVCRPTKCIHTPDPPAVLAEYISDEGLRRDNSARFLATPLYSDYESWFGQGDGKLSDIKFWKAMHTWACKLFVQQQGNAYCV